MHDMYHDLASIHRIPYFMDALNDPQAPKSLSHHDEMHVYIMSSSTAVYVYLASIHRIPYLWTLWMTPPKSLKKQKKTSVWYIHCSRSYAVQWDKDVTCYLKVTMLTLLVIWKSQCCFKKAKVSDAFLVRDHSRAIRQWRYLMFEESQSCFEETLVSDTAIACDQWDKDVTCCLRQRRYLLFESHNVALKTNQVSQAATRQWC